MAEIEYTLADLVKFSSEKKPTEFNSAFNSLMAGRVQAEVESRKLEIAQTMFNPQNKGEA